MEVLGNGSDSASCVGTCVTSGLCAIPLKSVGWCVVVLEFVQVQEPCLTGTEITLLKGMRVLRSSSGTSVGCDW